jgi:hypothetical protein
MPKMINIRVTKAVLCNPGGSVSVCIFTPRFITSCGPYVSDHISLVAKATHSYKRKWSSQRTWKEKMYSVKV